MNIKQILFTVVFVGATITYAMESDQQKTITISVECNEKIKQIKNDTERLKYYCEGSFQGIAKLDNPEIKPSEVINWLQKEKSTNEKTQLQFMPASTYISLFVQDNNDKFDDAFIKKYQETQNIVQTWKWFNDHFTEEGLKKPISAYLEKMAAIDAERLVLQEQGITFSPNGETVFIDGNQAEKYYNNKK